MAQDPYRYFRVEARDLLEQMGRGVLDLERGPSAELVARLLRLAHTLKGAARVVKQRAMADHAHSFEEVLGPHRASGGPVARPDIDALLTHLDFLTGALAVLDGPPAAPAGTAAASPAAPASPATSPRLDAPPSPSRLEEPARAHRPDSDDLSELLDGIGEIHAQIGGLRRIVAGIDDARSQLSALSAPRATRRAGPAGLPPGGTRDVPARGHLDELERSVDRLRDSLSTALDQLERETAQTRETAERMRLVAAEALFTPLQRTVRDTAVAVGRSVAFVGSGGDVRLDPVALSAVQAALVQLVRNAVAHGIERPDQRQAAGKAPEGRVTVTVQRRQAKVLFTCADDGAGVDVAAVRRIARQRGLLTGGDETTREPELLALLLRGGISTSTAVTEVSGRGVGLDVAREAAAELGGALAIESRPGAGTTVTLTIPALLAAVPALIVDSAGTKAAIPLDAVRGALRVEPGDVARRPDGDALIHEGRVIPLVPLSSSLGLSAERDAARNGGRRSALVVEGRNGARAAISVDRLLGTATVVSRPLPARAVASPVVAGAWTDADGTPQLVLDPAVLIDLAALRKIGEEATPMRIPPILVIDDSLTTRMLEQSILESAGYEVELAASAEEGLEKAGKTRYALFLVDIEMPGIDGFTFVERTRRDPVLREIPAILVSSRSAPEDLQRGKDVGAADYVVKGAFDQGALLDRIRTLVG